MQKHREVSALNHTLCGVVSLFDRVFWSRREWRDTSRGLKIDIKDATQGNWQKVHVVIRKPGWAESECIVVSCMRTEQGWLPIDGMVFSPRLPKELEYRLDFEVKSWAAPPTARLVGKDEQSKKYLKKVNLMLSPF